MAKFTVYLSHFKMQELVLWESNLLAFLDRLFAPADLLCFLYHNVQKKEKYCIQIPAYFQTFPNLSSQKCKKSFFKKNETSDILKTSCKVSKGPESWQFSEKLFTEAATGDVVYKSCSQNFANF